MIEFHRVLMTRTAVDPVWEVAGRPELLGAWSPQVFRCSMREDIRTLVLLDGEVVNDRITEVDDAEYLYRYESAQFSTTTWHSSCLSVAAVEGGTRVMWSGQVSSLTEADEVRAAERFGGFYAASLQGLRVKLERRGDGQSTAHGSQ